MPGIYFTTWASIYKRQMDSRGLLALDALILEKELIGA